MKRITLVFLAVLLPFAGATLVQSGTSTLLPRDPVTGQTPVIQPCPTPEECWGPEWQGLVYPLQGPKGDKGDPGVAGPPGSGGPASPVAGAGLLTGSLVAFPVGVTPTTPGLVLHAADVRLSNQVTVDMYRVQ